MMFYNVENLFEITNDPKTQDEDFTPEGKLAWNQERYEMKLKHIAEVMSGVDAKFPDVMGMCEVENKKVLEDLVAQEALKKAGYKIIHQDSPDERGIDVAMIYKSSSMKVISYRYFRVTLPSKVDPNTRDILYVKAEMGGDVVHFFVNHWPSRSGGQEVSEINRITAAQVLRSKLDSISKGDASAKILCMGDFNDHPSNKSIIETIYAGPNEKEEHGADLSTTEYAYYDYMWEEERKGEGSYFYKGAWGPIDQFIGSWSLVNATKGISASPESAIIWKNDLVLFADKEGVKRPNRTYVGNDYKGGFSDHLPIVMTMTVK